jgi:hypothetical protein
MNTSTQIRAGHGSSIDPNGAARSGALDPNG